MALAVVVGLLAYANGCLGTFQFDDYGSIIDAPRVHGWAAWLHGVLAGGLRPLLNLSYTASWVAGGGAPLSFHLGNLAIHACTVWLVYALAAGS